MRRECKENETAMQHYVKRYECASLNTFWPRMMLLCRRANAVVRWCVPAEVDAGVSSKRAVHLSLSLEGGVLSIVSKPKARLDWRSQVLSFEFRPRFALDHSCYKAAGRSITACDSSSRGLALAKDARPSQDV